VVCIIPYLNSGRQECYKNEQENKNDKSSVAGGEMATAVL
jgi:hypothetical protein